MAEARLSALILARDEAGNLPQCIESLRWVDEIVVVVDPASEDATEALARRLADRVLVRRFDNFSAQRNAGLDLARGDWIFSVDADERSSAEQATEIRCVLADARNPLAGYRVPIRSEILGRPFSYSGTQDDRPLRLFRRAAGRWEGDVHETVRLAGPCGLIRSPLSHRTLPDMRTFLRKLERYTTLDAARLHREGSRPRPGDLTLRPLWTFLKLYLGKQGFRDGPEGFMFCSLSGVSVGVRSWKQRELARSAGGPG